MFRITDKSENSIEELFNLINSTNNKEELNLYAYKLFMLLSYQERHDEALEVSKRITDSSINKVILLYLTYLDREYERVYLNSNIVYTLDIEVINNHHRHLVTFFKAIHYDYLEKYDECANLCFDVMENCRIDEILVEKALHKFLNIIKKCKSKDIFYDFYTTYYKSNKNRLEPKVIRMVESINNNLNLKNYTVDDVMDLYSKYVTTSISFRDYFCEASKELERFVDFDVAYLFIIDNDNVDTFEYKKGLVYDRYYRLYEVTDTIYNEIMTTKRPKIKKLGDKKNNDDIILFKNNKDTYDSYIALPVINNNEVIAVVAVSSNKNNISDYSDILKSYVTLVKFKVINRLNDHVAKFNRQVVGVLDDLTDGYFLEKKNTITLSDKAKKTFGVNKDELHMSELLSSIEPICVPDLKRALSRNNGISTIEVATRNKKILSIVSSVINLENRDNIKIGILRNLTDDRSQLTHYENLAYVDSLTTLPNYNSLMDAFRQIKPGEQVTFINFDINKFKLINDVYGHDVGDSALKFFGKALKICFDKLNGKVFRKSGDEFIVILDEVVTREMKIVALGQLSDYLGNKKNYPSDLPIVLEYSAGIASTRSTSKKDKETLFKYADLAMYEAKTSYQKNKYVFFDNERLLNYNLELEKIAHIEESVDKDTIEISYKDIICIDKTIHAYYVNISIPNVEMYDDELTEIAVKNELLYKLEAKVIEKVFSEQRAFINQTRLERNVHLPISSDTLITHAFYEFVLQKTKEFNISPDTITFVVRNLKDTANIGKISNKLNKYATGGYKLSFDFRYTEYPNTNFFNLVNFKYCIVTQDIFESLKTAKEKKDIYKRAVFGAVKDLGMEPIIDNIDINVEFKNIKENDIKYFTQIGRVGNKLLKEVIAEVSNRGEQDE